MPTVSWQSEKNGRLDAVLAEEMESISRSRAAALIRDGQVRVEGQTVHKASMKISEGQRLDVVLPPPKSIEAVPQALPLDVVYEDSSLVVVNKAAGMVVHPAPGHPDGTLVNALLHYVDDLSGIGGALRPGIVHRLDKGTSGLMVVAKNDHAHHMLAEQFAKKTAKRRYLALCFGAPKQDGGTIETELARHPSHRKRWASTDQGGKRAITHWRVLARGGTLSLIECALETGRTHQIRVHLTEAGFPLVGDSMYTRRHCVLPASIRGCLSDTKDRPMLHAWSLRFLHPKTNAAVRYNKKPPEDFWRCLEALGWTEALPKAIRP